MVILAFGTSGSRRVRSVACSAWCARGASIKPRTPSALPMPPQCHGTLPMAHSTSGTGRGTMPCGSAIGGTGAQVAYQSSQETQRSPLPHKRLETEKHLHCIPFCAVTWSWGTGVNPRSLLQSISSAPSPIPPTASQPGELLLRWEAKPKSEKLHRGPQEKFQGDPQHRTPQTAVTLQGYIPESRKLIWLGFTLCLPLCMGLACLEKGPGAPRPACTPKPPSPPEKKRGTENEIKA